MRIYACFVLFLFCLFLGIGCAGQETVGERDMAPYSAVVVFQWLEDDRDSADLIAAISSDEDQAGSDEPAAEAPADDADVSSLAEEADQNRWLDNNQRWVEDQIIAGLEEQNVFSDFVVADWENMYRVAEKMSADLIVVIRIGHLADWHEDEVRVDTGLAVLSGVLWFGTAIGGLWIEDQVYPTNSDIGVYWRRPPGPGSTLPVVERPREIDELETQFAGQRDSVYAGGEYNLSLWDRAKFWSTPSAYFTNLVCPPSLVPFHDDDEIDRSLAVDALKDVKLDLARKLGAGSLGSAGSPFVFRLENPANGAPVRGSSARLLFRYRLEPGFADAYQISGLSVLRVELKRDGGKWEPVKEYTDERIRAINDRIGKDLSIVETIEGLGPGLNLVRFSAEIDLDRQWITNTIALKGP